MEEAFGLSQLGTDCLVDKTGNLESKFLLNFHAKLRAQRVTKGKRQDNECTTLSRLPRILKGYLDWLSSKRDLPDKLQPPGLFLSPFLGNASF